MLLFFWFRVPKLWIEFEVWFEGKKVEVWFEKKKKWYNDLWNEYLRDRLKFVSSSDVILCG